MNRNPLRHALGSVVSVSFLAADGSEETVIGTLDEVSDSFLAIIHGAIGDVLEGKRKLAKALTAGGEGWICDLTDDELADLVLLSPLARQDAAA